ncbi:peroxiredoxin [Wenzhouxiangella sp. XN201]|uniref:peroxiredoxin n=1 Tax=Wenzhouxiangella sp. XN201 TaxID=2710755 RepID=UPI0013C6B32B|nr:peroxiredoxin [Wenzhouxiangella sp. XN201]NEZ03690.1 peroxiredoxin [Wenzhouxiangella sp. XN201]
MSLRIGDRAPDFTLVDDHGEPFTLSKHAGHRILLVFYPGDDTPVCTSQLCDYRDGIEQFEGLGVEVVGISGDDAASHRKFRERHQLPFTLLSDPDLGVAGQYGCRGMLGMKRGVFLVDEGGILRYAHVESVAVFRRSREELIEVIEQLE